MLEVIFSAIPSHCFRGISMQQMAATTYVIKQLHWQLPS
jgi:hypothetical protein